MRSLSELAEDYERLATQDESIVTGIMKSVDGFPPEARDGQLRQASLLTAEAESFRQHAARLRAFFATGLTVCFLLVTTSCMLGQQLRIVSNVPKLTFFRLAAVPPDVQVIGEEVANAVHLRLRRPAGGVLRIPLVARSNTAYQLSVQGSEGIEIGVSEVRPFAGTEYVMPGALNLRLEAPVSTSRIPVSILEGLRISNGGNNSTPNNAVLIELEAKVSNVDADLILLMKPIS
jgi:hypothetical protein